ncbi:pilus assembly PilX N-terminal domain-containing protein [Thioalkalivibrio sp. ALE23]|uniref:pilus assembly PilX N-terminal domain-containing protein n=1 Tax=Thioalkalivibrio sp. ALE23 TaxID=1265495 RepID=UPI00037DFAB4|nr:pilus assembly PilX N-terminal domain-containing protein [Thioalkalivibrio sp. ALE23]
MLIALFLLILVSVIAAGAATMIGSSTLVGSERVLGEKAMFAAESGVMRISADDMDCDGQAHPVGDAQRAGFQCTDAAQADCPGSAESEILGWGGAERLADAPASHRLCVHLEAVGSGGAPPSECDEAEWTCVTGDNGAPPGGSGGDFDYLFVGEDQTVQGGGNRGVNEEACFQDGAEVNGRLDFHDSVYWETEENTSGGSSNYYSCVYIEGELSNEYGNPGGCEETAEGGSWCPYGGGSGWGYGG